MPQIYPQSSKTHLSAVLGILSRVKASLIKLITDDRLWQGFQENEQCFSHGVITASWINLSQGKGAPGKSPHRDLICFLPPAPSGAFPSYYLGHTDPNWDLMQVGMLPVSCYRTDQRLLGGLAQLESGEYGVQNDIHTGSVLETSHQCFPSSSMS